MGAPYLEDIAEDVELLLICMIRFCPIHSQHNICRYKSDILKMQNEPEIRWS